MAVVIGQVVILTCNRPFKLWTGENSIRLFNFEKLENCDNSNSNVIE